MDKTLKVYNLAQLGVNVDTDNIHVPTGAFRQAQNIVRSSDSQEADSIVSRNGLRNLNAIVFSGSVLGGITVPAFEAGSGTPSLFLGFGD